VHYICISLEALKLFHNLSEEIIGKDEFGKNYCCIVSGPLLNWDQSKRIWLCVQN